MVLTTLLTTAIATLASTAPAPAGGAAELRPQRVVEHFTSQGCSACPIANRRLAELNARDDVLGLSFAVDYWDMLGWRDTFAMPENTERQRAYASRLDNRRVYTPQMVVDGHINVPGARVDKLEATLRVPVDHGNWRATVQSGQPGEGRRLLLQGAPGTEYQVTLIRFTSGMQETEITNGENAGVTVDHCNVVEEITPPRPLTAEGMLLASDDAYAVLVQAELEGPILAAFEVPAVR